MRARCISLMTLLALGALVAVPQTAMAQDAGPAQIKAAAVQGDAPLLSAEELTSLQEREAAAGDLADFHGGNGDAVVAWTALGVGAAALVLALIAL